MNEIIKAIQDSLALHWTAQQAYQSLAAQCRRAGYGKLADLFAADADEEKKHTARLLGRLEYLDAPPAFAHGQPMIGRLPDVAGLLGNLLALETAAGNAERFGITTARAAGDEGTALVFAENLEGSEEGIQRLTGWQRQVEAMGLQNWLSTMA